MDKIQPTNAPVENRELTDADLDLVAGGDREYRQHRKFGR